MVPKEQVRRFIHCAALNLVLTQLFQSSSPAASTYQPSPKSQDKNKGKGKAGVVSRREQVEARLRAWGAEDICVGEPLDVLRRFAEEGQSFDAILDTVGGVQGAGEELTWLKPR